MDRYSIVVDGQGRIGDFAKEFVSRDHFTRSDNVLYNFMLCSNIVEFCESNPGIDMEAVYFNYFTHIWFTNKQSFLLFKLRFM